MVKGILGGPEDVGGVKGVPGGPVRGGCNIGWLGGVLLGSLAAPILVTPPPICAPPVKQVFKELEFLGWYTTGGPPEPADISVHKQVGGPEGT